MTDPQFIKTGEIKIEGENPPSFSYISASKLSPKGVASTSNHKLYLFDSISARVISSFDAYPNLSPVSEDCITGMIMSTASDIIITCCGPEVSLFDSRSSSPIGVFNVRSYVHYVTEALSVGTSCDGCLIGAGTSVADSKSDGAGVLIWDVRKTDSKFKHVDIQPSSVGAIEFHPTSPSIFLSGDEDGNLLLFDIDEPNDEDGTIFYCNDVAPVFQCGFCGIDTIFTLRRTAGIHLYNFLDSSKDIVYDDLRTLCDSSFNFPVDAHWCGNWLMVVGGDSNGGAALSLVSSDGAKLFHKISNAHDDCINASHLDVFEDGSIKLYLAGNGGQLSFWKLDPSN